LVRLKYEPEGEIGTNTTECTRSFVPWQTTTWARRYVVEREHSATLTSRLRAKMILVVKQWFLSIVVHDDTLQWVIGSMED
jgi:hypothetical protein